MIKVALTGNIASGKSTVEKILAEQGFSVLDTDVVAHNLFDENNDLFKNLSNIDKTACLSEVKNVFAGQDILDNYGKISRPKLGKIVFENKAFLKQLEAIMYPFIRLIIKDFFEQHKQEDFVFVSAPQLYEANMQDLFDKVVLVYAEDASRFKRLIKRDGYSEDYALTRLMSQMSQDYKLLLCDNCIENNGEIEDLQDKVLCLLNRYQ